jgi:LmbE family N-acetylglucosaminyl deacetylase
MGVGASPRCPNPHTLCAQPGAHYNRPVATSNPLRLMAVFAHPDDESLATGSLLARYAAEGVETYLVTATRGERGWAGPPADNPGLEALGQIREAELRAAARLLALHEMNLLDYVDGDLDRADPHEATGRIVAHLRRVQPQVVVTFGPEGAYGHPDHIAISQFTTAAIVCAADAAYQPELGPAHRVAKLYYLADTGDLFQLYAACIGPMHIEVDGVQRQAVGWEEWKITTRIDADAYWEVAWQAFLCHVTQWAGYRPLEPLLAEHHATIIGMRTFYRAFSLVNGGRRLETDLFDGLR